MPHTPFTPATTLDAQPLALLAPEARAKPGPAERRNSAYLQRTLEYDLPGTWAGDKYEQTNHFTGVVSIAARAYLDFISGAEFRVERRKRPARDGVVRKAYHGGPDEDYEPADPDEPLCRIVEQPGGEDGAWSLGQECGYLTLQHLLTGDAPAWCPVNADGKPVRFFALTSALCQPLFAAGVNPQYPKGAYRVTPYGGTGFYLAGGLAQSAVLPGEEVKRFREYHPWSRAMGMSRLQSGAKEIDVLEAIMQSRWAMFDHGMQLDLLALVPNMSQEEAEQAQAAMTRRHGGAKNARRFAILSTPGGEQSKPTIQTFGQSAREMDYGTSYDQQAGVVLALLRVPKGVAGFTSQSSYAQHYAELQQFFDLGLTPYCRALSCYLTQALARPWSEYPGEYRIVVEPHKPVNVEMEAHELEFASGQGLISVNDYLRATKRKPVKGGDVPLSVYLAKLQQDIAPQPQPGSPGQPGGEGGEGGVDPLAALLGGGAGVPQPDNPASEGSLPPRVKAMSSLVGSAGGYLVEPGRAARRRKRRAGKRVLSAMLKALDAGE